MSAGNSSSKHWPLIFQISLSKRRALTVHGATNPAGSNTEGTKLKMVRWVIALSRGRSTPLLRANVSFTWSHLRPKTCDDCSAPLLISLMGENEVSQSSGFIAEVISSALPTNLVKLNPPNLSNKTVRRIYGECNDELSHRKWYLPASKNGAKFERGRGFLPGGIYVLYPRRRRTCVDGIAKDQKLNFE